MMKTPTIEEIRQRFVSIHKHGRYDLDKPLVRNGKRICTDGRLYLIEDAPNEPDTEGTYPGDVDTICDQYDWTAQWSDRPLTVRMPDPIPCDNCGGTGCMRWDNEIEEYLSCTEKDKGAETCGECDGHKEFPDWTKSRKVGSGRYADALLFQIVDLPGLKWRCAGDKQPLLFMFDGGRGLIMWTEEPDDKTRR